MIQPTTPYYIIGIDPCGYDGSTYSYCVIRRSDSFIEDFGTTRDKDEFEKEVDRLAEYYQAPILKEIDR